MLERKNSAGTEWPELAARGRRLRSWKSKLAMAIGVGLPLAVLGAAQPAAAIPDDGNAGSSTGSDDGGSDDGGSDDGGSDDGDSDDGGSDDGDSDDGDSDDGDSDDGGSDDGGSDDGDSGSGDSGSGFDRGGFGISNSNFGSNDAGSNGGGSRNDTPSAQPAAATADDGFADTTQSTANTSTADTSPAEVGTEDNSAEAAAAADPGTGGYGEAGLGPDATAPAAPETATAPPDNTADAYNQAAFGQPSGVPATNTAAPTNTPAPTQTPAATQSAAVNDITTVSTELGGANYTFGQTSFFAGVKVQAGVPHVATARSITGPVRESLSINSDEGSTQKTREGIANVTSGVLGSPSRGYSGLVQGEYHTGTSDHVIEGPDNLVGEATGDYTTYTGIAQVDIGRSRSIAAYNHTTEEVSGSTVQADLGDPADPTDDNVRTSSYDAELSLDSLALGTGLGGSKEVGPRATVSGQPVIGGEGIGGIRGLRAESTVQERSTETSQPGVQTTTTVNTTSYAIGGRAAGEATAAGGNGVSPAARANGSFSGMANVSRQQDAEISTTLNGAPHSLANVHKSENMFAEESVDYDRATFDPRGDVDTIDRGRITNGNLTPDTTADSRVTVADDGTVQARAGRTTDNFFGADEEVDVESAVAPDGTLTQTESSTIDGYMTDVDKERTTVIDPEGRISVTETTDSNGVGVNSVTVDEANVDAQGNVSRSRSVAHTGTFVDNRTELTESTARPGGAVTHAETVIDHGVFTDDTESDVYAAIPGVGVSRTHSVVDEGLFTTDTESTRTVVTNDEISTTHTVVDEGIFTDETTVAGVDFDGSTVTESLETTVDGPLSPPTTTVSPDITTPVTDSLTVSRVVDDPIFGSTQTSDTTYSRTSDGMSATTVDRTGEVPTGVTVDAIRGDTMSSDVDTFDDGLLSETTNSEELSADATSAEISIAESTDGTMGDTSAEATVSSDPDAASASTTETDEAIITDESTTTSVSSDDGSAEVSTTRTTEDYLTDEADIDSAMVDADGTATVFDATTTDGSTANSYRSATITADAERNVSIETETSLDRAVHADRTATSVTDIDSEGTISGVDTVTENSVFSPPVTRVTTFGPASGTPADPNMVTPDSPPAADEVTPDGPGVDDPEGSDGPGVDDPEGSDGPGEDEPTSDESGLPDSETQDETGFPGFDTDITVTSIDDGGDDNNDNGNDGDTGPLCTALPDGVWDPANPPFPPCPPLVCFAARPDGAINPPPASYGDATLISYLYNGEIFDCWLPESITAIPV